MSFTRDFASVKAIYLRAMSSHRVDDSMLCTTGKDQHYIIKTCNPSEVSFHQGQQRRN